MVCSLACFSVRASWSVLVVNSQPGAFSMDIVLRLRYKSRGPEEARMMSRIALRIEKERFAVELYNSEAPIACRALLKLLPIRKSLLPAAWSGPVGFITDVNLMDAPLENPTSWLWPGTITYHPSHHDIGFAFAITQNNEPSGAVQVSLIARIVDNLDTFRHLAESLQRSGSKHLRLYETGKRPTALAS